MRDRLIKLIAEVQYMGGLEEKLADHLINNGVLAVDFGVVSTRNRPLISQCFGRPLDEVLDLFRTKQEWISVEDRLPEENGVYLCCGYYEGYGKQEIETIEYFHLWCGSVGFVVTHWMPLPEPPKMKGGVE